MLVNALVVSRNKKHNIHDLVKIKIARQEAGLRPLTKMEWIQLWRGDPNARIVY